jgi:hypothetical protein
MKKDYPEYYPPFMQDFHDCKNFIKAFYVWLDMLDNRREMNGEKFDKTYKRRTDMCDWVSFHILAVSLLDFLHRFGYQVYRTRKRGEYANIDDIREFSQLNELYFSICNPDHPLADTKEYIAMKLEQWHEFVQYMPREVREKLQHIDEMESE